MSTLRVDTIQNAAGTDSPISVPGTAKAWVNFNGTGAVAIRASYNVSSITDNGTGKYTISFTTAMPDANYTVVGTVSNTGDGWVNELSGSARGSSGLEQNGSTQPTSSALVIDTRYGSSAAADGSVADFSAVYVAIFR